MEFGVQPPHASLLFVDVRFQIIPPLTFLCRVSLPIVG